MKGASFRLFMTEEEYRKVIYELIVYKSVYAYGAHHARMVDFVPLGEGEIKKTPLQGFTCLYLAEREVEVKSIDAKMMMPAKYGLIRCDIPTSENQNIYLFQISFISTWRDLETREIHLNPSISNFFSMVKRAFLESAQLKVAYSTAGQSDKKNAIGVYCSSGVSVLEKAGFYLKQKEVRNIFFHCL